MIRHLLIAAVVLSAAFPGPSASRWSAAAAQVGPTNDLVASLLAPKDLAALRLHDYGTGVGAAGGVETLFAFDHAYRGAGHDDGRFLSTADPDRGAALYLIDQSGADQPARVISSIVVFAGAKDASTAFDRIDVARSDVARSSDPEPQIDTDSDIDAASAFVIDGVAPYDDENLQQTSIVAQVGPVLVDVAIERFDGTAAPVDAAASLLSVVLGRLDQTDSDEAAPGLTAFEVTGPDIVPSLNRFVYRDGTIIPQFGQADDAADTQATTFEMYDAEEVLQVAYTSTDGSVIIGGFLSHHASDDAARSYFRAIPDLIATNDQYAEVRIGNAIVRVGDAATLVTYSVAEDEGVVVTELVVLFGDTVAELIVDASTPASTDDMTVLARAAESCLSSSTCDPVVIPDDAVFSLS